VIDVLAACLQEWAIPLAPAQPCLIYGDFHCGQLLVTSDDRVVLLDFDAFAMGDPERDLAEFMVDLHFLGLDPHLVEAMCACLVASYERHAGRAVQRGHLAWHLLHQLLDKAYHWYVQLRPDLELCFAQVLVRAKSLAAGEWRRVAE
jgi:aminoglycoside phosphotransferase (APT) family kinase protein